MAETLEGLLLRALDNVVSTSLLVASDKGGVKAGGHGLHLGELVADLTLQISVEDIRPVHGLSQVHGGNVPA